MPVQGYGTVDGLNWYFRARWNAWSFEVWREPFGPKGQLPDPDSLWGTGGDYGTEPCAASHMPLTEAWERVEQSIAKGRAANWVMPERDEGNL